MSVPPADIEPLIINGITLDPNMLETRPLRRCALEECQANCCGWGVYISTKQAEDILVHQQLIFPHLPEDRRNPQQWFDWVVTEDTDDPQRQMVTATTSLPDPTHPAGQHCIFLRPDRKCALQVAGVEAGEHPWRFKPFYCALHPLAYENGRLIFDDESEVYLDGGSCSRAATGELIPVYQLFDFETKLVLGEEGYALLEKQATASG